MVRLASRMFSAISFGVFCRLAPSTSAIIRSMNVSPGIDVIWTTIRSDSTLVPPVTALRSPPDSRITGADSPVMADSSTDATPSTTSPSPGMTSFGSTTTRSPGSNCVPGTTLLGTVGQEPASHRLLASGTQRRRLRLPAALGHGLRHVREQRGQPEPHGDLSGEERRIEGEQDRREHGADLDHEHHGVLRHRPRVQLPQCIRERRQEHLQVHVSNPSTIGPSDSAGKYVSAVTMRITPTSRPPKSTESVGKVPSDAGTCFFFPSEPARASANTISA